MARGAAFGIPRYEAKKVNWRNAMLNLKGVLERHGIPFPTIREVEISGQEARHVDVTETIRLLTLSARLV